MKHLRYAGPEVKAFRAKSIHLHVTDGGCIESWGNGKQVLLIRHPCKRNRTAEAILFGPKGKNMWGGPFRYWDYFLNKSDAKAQMVRMAGIAVLAKGKS